MGVQTQMSKYNDDMKSTCQTCNGLGKVPMTQEELKARMDTRPVMEWLNATDMKPCPECGGIGEQRSA